MSLLDTWGSTTLYQFYTNFNTWDVPATYQPKISLGPNTKTRLVWKFFKKSSQKPVPWLVWIFLKVPNTRTSSCVQKLIWNQHWNLCYLQQHVCLSLEGGVLSFGSSYQGNILNFRTSLCILMRFLVYMEWFSSGLVSLLLVPYITQWRPESYGIHQP
jgi:hypothetical protein